MQELNGVFWDQCEIPYGISSPIDREKCCLFLLENLAPYTWNTLRSFENSPATLAQTASILHLKLDKNQITMIDAVIIVEALYRKCLNFSHKCAIKFLT